MEFEPTGTFGIVAASITTGAAALFALKKVWRVFIKPKLVERANRKAYEAETHLICRKIYKEVTYNSGTSLKDQMSRVENDIRKLKFIRNSINQLDCRAMFYTDKEGLTVWANNAYLRLVGRPLSDIVGHGWLNCVHAHDREAVRHEWKNCVEEQRNFEMSYRYVVGNTLKNVRCVTIFDEQSGQFGIVIPVSNKATDNCPYVDCGDQNNESKY